MTVSRPLSESPIPRKDEAEIDRDAVHAVRCAIAMEQELSVLNERWEREGLPSVAIRIGIHTGSMVAASIGAKAHLEYSLVGDNVIIAARLQNLPTMLPSYVSSAPCCTLVGESTWERLHGEFNGRLLGNMALKGKKRKVNVYQIVTDDAEGEIVLAAAEYNTLIDRASNLSPTGVGRGK